MRKEILTTILFLICLQYTFAQKPSITSFTPTSGVPGTTIFISGNNLSSVTSVTIGGQNEPFFTVFDNNDIECPETSLSPGQSGQITVTSPGGTASSLGIYICIAYSINSFLPTFDTTGGTISIIGNFYNAPINSVKIGGVAAASFSVVNDTQINAVIGAGATGHITVTSPNFPGTITSSNVFTYIPPKPTITSFIPTSAPYGTTITIKGRYFTGTSSVSFGDVTATSFNVLNDSTITTVVGSGATGNITVTTPGGTTISTNTFTFLPPTITSFIPTSAPYGTTITIKGKYFTGASSVSFGGVAASSFNVVNDTTISTVVGSGATGNITVTTPGGTATSSNTFTYILPPSITSFTPSAVFSGTTVSIIGTNFTGTTNVKFGNVSASSFTVISSTQINAVVGTCGGDNISVTNSGGIAMSSGVYTCIGYSINSFYPSGEDTTGALVYIYGNFGYATIDSVSFGGVAATSFYVLNDTTIVAFVGSGATGYITITSPDFPETLKSTQIFTYIPHPKINSFTPINGTTGTTVIIRGINFTGVTSVSLGGIAVTSFKVISDSIISVVVGSGASGNINVSNQYGTVSLAGFTFNPPNKLCNGGYYYFISNLEGNNYQWQVNIGNGFNSISDNTYYSGVNSDTLYLSNIPSSQYGYIFQCLVDSNISNAFSIQFINTWTGTVSSAWENPLNWSCKSVPDANSDIYINSGTVVLSSNSSVRSITVSPSASFTITTGNNLTVTH